MNVCMSVYVCICICIRIYYTANNTVGPASPHYTHFHADTDTGTKAHTVSELLPEPDNIRI